MDERRCRHDMMMIQLLILFTVFFTTDPFDLLSWSQCDAPCDGGTRSRQSELMQQVIDCNIQSCDYGMAFELQFSFFLLCSSFSYVLIDNIENGRVMAIR